MKSLNIMIKPASSLCNMRCKYCFYADVANNREIKSCGIMTNEIRELLLKRVEEEFDDGDSVRFIFQGGEPTLAGLPYFREFIHTVQGWKKDIKVSYALQTNGILLDREWCSFLKENHFLVGVSLDILPECHDAVRLDAQGMDTYKRVLSGINLLEKHGVEYNVLCTLTNQIARFPQKVWNKLLELSIKYVQFTPCLGELDDSISSSYELSPRRFASFYIQLFRLWYDAYRQGRYISIKLFEDIVNLIVLGRPTSCGMNGICQPQFVVEADASVYPCDFYCLDQYKLGNLKKHSIAQLLNSDGVQKFMSRPHIQPQLCNGCRYISFCGGNCKRMQKEICSFRENSHCGYREFLDACGEGFNQIAKEIIYKNNIKRK